MASIHLILSTGGNGDLSGLTRIERDIYRSCCCDIDADKAELLIKGKIYLHNSKREKSRFGGSVRSFEPMVVDGVAREHRIAFIFTAELEARNLKWRGADHAMAWSSGILDD